MNKFNLLPRWTRYIGLILILPCLMTFFYDPDVVFDGTSFLGSKEARFETEVLALFDQSSGRENGDFVFYSWVNNDISNEIMLTLMLLGTYFIAFARIKEEDEFSNQLRLEAMTQAIVYNSILLLLLNWLFYDGLFLFVLISQLFSFLLIFSIVFAFKIRKHRKLLSNEE